MLETFNRMAEQAATGVSRRQFLGLLGSAALAAAAASGGLMAMSDIAQAARGVCSPASTGLCKGLPFNHACGRGRGARCRPITNTGICQCL